MGYFTLILLFYIAAFANGMYEGQSSSGVNETCPEDEEFIREVKAELPQQTANAYLYDTGSSSDQTSSNTEKDMRFLVYKRHEIHNPFELKFNSAVDPVYVKKEWPTFIYIHGWVSKPVSIYPLTKAYWAKEDYKMNVIEVDWSKGAYNPVYFPCAKRVPRVGQTIAKFIKHNREHIDVDKLILVGHSLGAHAAGFVGKTLQKDYKLTVPRIVGLDPAGFRFRGHNKKLQPGDAREVIVIHSSSTAGHLAPLGTLDIYLNGGKKQPGCNFILSHRFARNFYEHILKENKPVVGYEYMSFADVKNDIIPKFGKINLFCENPLPRNRTLVYFSTKNMPNLTCENVVVNDNELPAFSSCLSFRLSS